MSLSEDFRSWFFISVVSRKVINCDLTESGWLSQYCLIVTDLSWIFIVVLREVISAGWLAGACARNTCTHTVTQITLINGENQIFPHRNGGRSLSLLIAFLFFASHSSCSQLCADRLEWDYLLWFTYVHYCTIVLGKWRGIDGCVAFSSACCVR